MHGLYPLPDTDNGGGGGERQRLKYLWSGGGLYDDIFYGIITTPGHKGIPIGIKNGMNWAADNQAFTKGFDADRFIPWLNKMSVYKSACLFVACPDKVGSAKETINLFYHWRGVFSDWPVAFVAQDGQESLDFPKAEKWDTLFIGGSTAWKESVSAIETIKRAQALRKHIHIGRVNWKRRFDLFSQIQGSEDFTLDGTRQRFEGREKTIKAWSDYQKSNALKIW